MRFISIQIAKGPKRNFLIDSTLDVVGCEITVFFVPYLPERLVGTAHFNNDIAVNAEVASRQATILDLVPGTGKLIAKERLPDSADLRLDRRKRIDR